MDHEPGMRSHSCSLGALHGGGTATSSHGVVLGWPQQRAVGDRADLPGTTCAYTGACEAWPACAAGTQGLEAQTEAAGSAQAPLCSEACAGAAALCAQPAPCSRHQGATQHGAKCVSEAQTPVLSLSKQPLLPESIPSCKLSTRLETGQL